MLLSLTLSLHITMGLRTLLGLKKPDQTDYNNTSYAQEGEDAILSRLFEHRPNGFFIDVGAHHPKKYSNTYKFYQLGWRGINIDAMPGSMSAFELTRPEDINLEIPVGNKEEELIFYMFNEPALNTFCETYARERNNTGNYKIEKTTNIKTRRLDNILDQYLPAGQPISFLTIDAEGYDYKILQSNNWVKYRPEVVLVESELPFTDFLQSELYLFMQVQGYAFIAKTVKTYFLEDMINKSRVEQ